jgi:molecular chaperone DnaK (HSP70)
MGVAAKQQMMTNLRNTVTDLKHLIGRKFSDPITQEAIKSFPFATTQLPGDVIGIKVDFLGETRVFTVEQVSSMVLLKLKDSTEKYLKTKVSDCVVSVPCFWTDAQRRALLDAMKIADLNCLRILNETTAVALAYGIYKQDLPAEKEKPRHVVFLDVGASATQACLVAYNKGKLKVIGTSWDLGLGGRTFDVILRDHFCGVFKQKYKIDASSHPRPWTRLLGECEKLKKLMSANSQKIPINIECFMEDKDVTAGLQRADFEEMCEGLWARLRGVLERLIQENNVKPGDVDSIELVGGSTRIPRVKQTVVEVFGKEPATTLNQDEAVSRGCALQCAMLSPTFRVREFSVTDAQPFAIKLSWSGDKGDDGEMVVFEENHAFPFSKMLTFYRKDPFVLNASYNLPNHIPYPSHEIGRFGIKGVVPTPEGESSKVKVKVRINQNGLVTVASAYMYEKQLPVEEEAEAEQQEAMDTQAENAAPPQDTPSTEQNGPAGTEPEATTSQDPNAPPPKEEAPSKEGSAPPPPAEPEKPKSPPKPKVKSIDLPIEEMVQQLSRADLDRLKTMETEMAKQDREEREKGEARNELEEYVYETRDKLYGELEQFITEHERTDFSKKLQDTEDWIYDEGDDQPKQVYLDKLDGLKKIGDPVKERWAEYQGRPKAFEDLGHAIQRARKFVDQFFAGEEKYNHLDQKDVERVGKAVEEKGAWFEKQCNAQNRRPLTDPPVVFVSQLISERDALNRVVAPVMTKPKPKVEPPPEEKKEEKGGEGEKTAPPPGKDGAPPAGPQPQAQPTANGDYKTNDSMEVD